MERSPARYAIGMDATAAAASRFSATRSRAASGHPVDPQPDEQAQCDYRHLSEGAEEAHLARRGMQHHHGDDRERERRDRRAEIRDRLAGQQRHEGPVAEHGTTSSPADQVDTRIRHRRSMVGRWSEDKPAVREGDV
jgi:hypothetical protein